jgi:hypothetical protein
VEYKEIEIGIDITNVVFCSNISETWDYEIQSHSTYKSGDTVWMYCKAVGMTEKGMDDNKSVFG